MERQPNKTERPEVTVGDIRFEIMTEKNELLKSQVMDLLHEYPDQFVPGLFEPAAEQDFADSHIVIAHYGEIPVGCLMFNPTTKEYNWLAVKRGMNLPKREIARHLFESFYPSIEPGTEVYAFPNTEDAHIPEVPSFSGKSFDAARDLYRSMGWEMKEENIIQDHYGPGAHVYKVAWVPNKKID